MNAGSSSRPQGARTLAVLTGASRGLGLAMAQQLLRPGHRVLCLSRGRSEALADLAAQRGAELLQLQLDLAEPLPATWRLQEELGACGAHDWDRAWLVNNAAAITPPGPVEDLALPTLSAALRVGLEAPTLLAAAFLAATRSWDAQRRVLFISSGLGRRAMAGAAPYCAVKAGLDHLARAMSLDEARRERPAGVVSLAPGVIDTDMQVQLRSADPAAFPDRDRFVELKTGGALDSPEAAASKVLAYLARDDFGSTPVADVRG